MRSRSNRSKSLTKASRSRTTDGQLLSAGRVPLQGGGPRPAAERQRRPLHRGGRPVGRGGHGGGRRRWGEPFHSEVYDANELSGAGAQTGPAAAIARARLDPAAYRKRYRRAEE